MTGLRSGGVCEKFACWLFVWNDFGCTVEIVRYEMEGVLKGFHLKSRKSVRRNCRFSEKEG